MALLADVTGRRIENLDAGYVQTMNVAASEAKIFIGGATFLDSAGYATSEDNGGANKFLGICEVGFDNSGTASITTNKPVKVRYGHIEQVPLSGAAITDIGKLIYATDDNVFTLTATTASVVGRVYDLGTVADTARVEFLRLDGLPT